MSLEDAMGTQDPQGLVADLIGQREPDLVQNGNVDPQSVLNRLIRRQQGKQQERRQAPQAPKQEPVDFSAYGHTEEEAPPPPDFAQFGEEEPAKTVAPKKPSEGWGLSEVPGVLGRSAGQAAVKSIGAGAKLGALTPEMEAGARAQLKPQEPQPVDPELSAQANEDYAAASAPFRKEVKARERQRGAAEERLAERRAVPIEERGPYKVGQNIQDWADTAIPVTPEERAKHPIASQFGGMLGTAGPVVLAGAGATAIGGPALGLATAGGLMAAQSAGDEFDRARTAIDEQIASARKDGDKAKAEKLAATKDEVAAKAAGLSAVVNGTIGLLPVGVILSPVKTIAPGLTGRLWAMLDHAWKSGVTFAGVGEAQHYIGEQLAREFDPKAEYHFDYERLVAELLAGGALGAGHAAFQGRPAAAQQQQQPGAQTGTGPQAGLPPPAGAQGATGAGPQPQAGPGGAGAAAPPPFQTTMRPKLRTTLEEKAAYYKEHSAEDIASWSDEKLKEYVNVKGGMGMAPDEDILRRAGYADDDLKGMTPEQKAEAVKEAKSYGIHAGEESEVEGSREAPVQPKTAEDVARAAATAKADHTPAQGEANNVQRGHMVVLADEAGKGGLGVTIEAAKGGMRRGTAPDGTPFETQVGAHYGYFKGLPVGADGGAPDVFVGDHPTSPTVFVIDENDPKTGKFRQTKSFVGFQTFEQVLNAYLDTSSKDSSHVGGMKVYPVEEFKKLAKAGWLSRPLTSESEPAAEFKGAAKSGGLSKPVVPAAESRPTEATSKSDVPAEVTADHVDAVDEAIRASGTDPDAVDHGDIVRAAEIHAREGIPADEAFLAAVVRGMVQDGHVTEQEARDALGAQAKAILHPSGSVGGVSPPEKTSSSARGAAPEAKGGVDTGRSEDRGQARPAEDGREREAAAAGSPADRGRVVDQAAGRERTPATEAGKPDREGAGRGPREHGGETGGQAAGRPLIGDIVSTMPEHNVTGADNKAVRVRPVVVEASKLITSWNPGYEKALQPRQRDRAASQAQIREIATRLDPERLGYSAEADRGAPIVGPDRMVESGNGRVAALRALYRTKGPNADKYREWLKAQGVDVGKFKEPILVRQRVTDLEPHERTAFTVAANQPATLSMSAPERAMADARHLTPNTLAMIEDAGNLGAAGNRGFVRAFIAAIPASERGALTTAGGGLSAEGLNRARNAVLAKAYGDADVLARITESTDDEIRSISNALVMAAPQWAKLISEIDDGRVRADLDTTPELMAAVKQTADIRSKGQKLDDYLRQKDAFDQLPGPVEAFMRYFYDPAGRRAASAPSIAASLRWYAEQAAKVTTDKGLDLGAPEVTADEILAKGADQLQGTSGVGARHGADRIEGREGAAGSRVGARGAEVAGRSERGEPELRSGLAEPEDLFGVDTGAEGKPQLVIPGAGRISTADLARRRAAEPLKPRVAQRSLEHGLFGDESKQGDLLEKAPTTPQISGKEPVHEREPVREGAPPVPQGKPAGRAQGVASRPGRPDQLSLFGGEGVGATVQQPARPNAPEPGVPEPPVEPEGGSVTKPPRVGPRDGDARPRPAAGARGASDRGLKAAREKIAERSRLNYRITDDDHIGEGGPKQKVRGNLDAIRVLKTIEDENRQATPDEKAMLVKYAGWGAFAQDVFATHKGEWKAEREALRSLLTESEFEAAKGSTLNAHFTSPDVVRGMWDVLDHLGFKGGLAIEPSAGAGHFIGLIPDKVAPKTAWTATELDPITGRIAAALYAGAEVHVQGYEELKRPSNYYDVAISNVPFGDYNISEKPYGTFPIHDFFFVKSLDKVRPGGVVAFITSRYTMDRVDSATRRLLSKTSDLVGAIRLPGGRKGAFAGNAGTEVTTDIIFLRKKVSGERPFNGEGWLDTREITTPEGPVKINEYFARNPQMMLGDMRLVGSMYGKNEPVLIGESDGIREKIAAAARSGMEKGAILPRGEPPPPTLPTDETAGVKDGAFFMKGDKLYQRRQGQGHEQSLSPDNHDRVKRLVGMRDIVNDLLGSQIQGPSANPRAAAAENEAIRGKLQKAYDAFVRKHGPINLETTTVTSRLNKAGEPVVITRMPNFDPFRSDPDAYKVAMIENYNRETGKAKPADIQTKDVIATPTTRAINSPSDALATSLDQTGGVDLDHIADSLGLDSPEAAVNTLGDLIFHNPDGRAWQTADTYLSGDVVKKLEEARVIAQEDKSYERNVRALEKVQPEPLTRADITAQFGAPWVPEKVYADFFKEALGAGNVKVRKVPVTGEWKVDIGNVSRDAQSKYATDRTSISEVAKAAMNNRQITVYDEDADGKKSVNQPATEAARIRTEALKEAFAGDHETGIEGWVWSDNDRSKELEAIYNRTFNNLIPQKFDGSHLTFPGLNPMFADRQHRKDVVWRMVQRGNTLLAHVVGSGKTVTMIAGGMEMKRLGLINKPAYVVPNHMLEQFSREFIQAYPNAKILVAQKDEMTRDRRKEFLAKVSANDWDGVVITHDAFGRINMNLEWRKDFVREQMAELERIMAAEVKEDGKGSPTVKALEKAKKRLQGKLDKLLNEERKDEGTTFEESGIDHLFVDEAHKMKNLSFISRMQRVKGLAQGDSQRAEDLFLKIRYLEQKRPSRSAVFATGTPVSNTMAELWTMQRYLQLEALRERDLDVFDNWANTFGRVVNNMELSADGRTMKEVSSFSKFVNVPELISLYSEIADTKTADMLKLPRPEVRRPDGTPGIEIVEAEPSAQEEEYIQSLVKLAEEIKGKRPEPGQPNMLSVVTRGRKVATDGRLIGAHFDFNPRGKIALAVNNIHEIWKNGKEPGTVQMVFLDLGTPKTGAASLKAVNMGDEKWLALPPGAVEDGFSLAVPTETDDGRYHILNPEGLSVGSGKTQPEAVKAARPHFPAEASRLDLYADIKRRLVERGIPEKQIASIHDATDDAKKARLFQRVRSGDIRVLLGSSEKMGVGTNVQDRLIAMHHLDAPWKPAEVEQRDGRIVRQGNLNPNVRIFRYVTKKSFDAFMWQKLDTKSKFIGQVLSGAKGSRHAEDIDNPLPEAAEMKAAASGDPRIMEHAELDRQVRQLAAQKRAFDQTRSRADWEQKSAKSAIDLYEKELPGAKADAAKVEDLAGDKFKVMLGDNEVTKRADAGRAILDRMLALDARNFYSPKVVNVGTMSGFEMNIQVQGKWSGDGAYLVGEPSLKSGEKGYGGHNEIAFNPQTDPGGIMRRFENVLANIRVQPERVERAIASERDNLARIEKTLKEAWPKEKEYRTAVAKLEALMREMKAPQSSDAGMPSLAASSGETGLHAPGMNSSIEAPPGTQPSPAFQDSTLAEPSGFSTMRATPPSIFEGPITPRFSDLVLGDIDQVSTKYIVQGSNDVNALRAAAEENKARFVERLREITEAVPGTEFYGARVKDLAGLVEKVQAKGRPPSTISDYLGARVTVDTPEAMHAFVAELERTGAIIEAENFLAPGKDGYRAYHLQVGLGDGTSAELQLVPRAIADAMEESHALRQPVKRLKDQGRFSEIQAAIAASQKVLDDAWAKAAPEWHAYEVPTGLGEGAFRFRRLPAITAEGAKAAATWVRQNAANIAGPDPVRFWTAKAITGLINHVGHFSDPNVNKIVDYTVDNLAVTMKVTKAQAAEKLQNGIRALAKLRRAANLKNDGVLRILNGFSDAAPDLFGPRGQGSAAPLKLTLNPKLPAGRQAQAHVVERGLATGNEHLVAVDADGKIIGQVSGGPAYVSIAGEVDRALHDPGRAIVIHHNHPSDVGLSPLDIAKLGLPGLSSVWAHGHGGNVARASLTPAARARLGRFEPKEAEKQLYYTTQIAQNTLYDPLQNAVLAGFLTPDQARAALAYLIPTALHRAGILDHRSNTEIDKLVADLNLEPYIERAARAAAGRLLNAPGTIQRAKPDDRRAEPLRHLGDLGATFERTPPAAQERRAPPPNDRNRAKMDRAEAAGQARLPGLGQPGDPFFDRWFGDSKVVDAQGKPLRVYHGTTEAFDAFDPSKLGASTRHPSSKLGFFFSADSNIAAMFAGDTWDLRTYPPTRAHAPGANVMPVYLSIKNPFPLSVEQFREINARPFGEDFEREQPEAAKRVADWIGKNKASIVAKGYDGIRIGGDPKYAERMGGEEYAADAWVAFHPEQIKSATGNRGTFDPNNPSILAEPDDTTFRARATAGGTTPPPGGGTPGGGAGAGGPGAPPPGTPPGGTRATPGASGAPRIDLPTELIADHLEARNLPKLASVSRGAGIGGVNTTEIRTQVQDKFIRWKHMQEAAEKATGNPTPEPRDIYLAESLYYGRAGERLEQLDRSHIDPLIKDIQARGLTLEGVNEFLMARHAPERNAVLRKINHPPLGTLQTNVPDPSGMSDAEAARIIAAVDASGKRADYDAVEKRVRALIDNTLNTLVTGGLINKETAAAWKRLYKNYVPLRGFAEDAEVEAPKGTAKGFDIRGPESKQALGRRSLADGPLGYVMLQAQQAIIRSEKARVGRTALRFVMAHPDPDLWSIDRGDMKRAIDPSTGLVHYVEDPMWRMKPNVFAVKVDGVPHYINFKGDHGENLARALKNLGMSNMHPMLRLVAALTRMQARLATSWNPDFMIPNFTRDIGEAFINMQEHERTTFTRRFAKHLFPSLPGTFQALTGQVGGRYAAAFREFDQNGGRIRFFGMEDVEDIKSAVASKMRRLQGGVVNTAIGAGEHVVEAIDIANGTIENATRLAAYMAARDIGMSPAKAASIAREMTVNFNRKGELGSVISGLYLFANAAMQGSTRMLGALSTSKKVRRAAYALAAAAAALTAYNLLVGGDDKDGRSFYSKIAPWTRGTNLIIMWPKGMGHDGEYAKIPLPYGYSFFHVIGAQSMEVALGKTKPGKAVGTIASSVLDAFDPLGKDENMLAQFAPSLIRPVIHLATNENWTGRPINPQVEPWNKHDPDASRYFRSASPFSRAAAQKINEWTGGNKHESGYVDWSPGSIDYMLGFVTGGLGRFAMNAATTGQRAYEGSEWLVEKTPVLRRFYGVPEIAADRAIYFEDREASKNAWARLKGYEKDKDPRAAQRLRQEFQPEIATHSAFEAADKRRRTVLKQIDEIRANDKLPAAERDKQIKAKEQEELTIMLGVRQRLDKLRKEHKDKQGAAKVPRQEVEIGELRVE